MKAVEITRFGKPEVLKLVDKPSPALEPGSVRIGVKAAGLNFADVMMRMGLYPEAPKPPFVPGYEVAGEILETAPGVTEFKPGDRVLAPLKFGGYASEVVLPAFQVRKTPSGLSDVEAAAIPTVFLTAWVALVEMSRVRKGDRVLVHSAAGGVGTAAVQIAASRGAEVVGLTGSPSKADFVKSLGASEVWTTDDFMSRSPERTGGFDIILDPVGGKSLKHGFKCLKTTGRIVNFGMSAGVTGETRSIGKLLRFLVNMPVYTPVGLMMASKGVFGLNMLTVTAKPENITHVLNDILAEFEQRKLKVIVGKTFPADQAGAAQEHLMSRQNVGKVVLTF